MIDTLETVHKHGVKVVDFIFKIIMTKYPLNVLNLFNYVFFTNLTTDRVSFTNYL